MVDADLGGALAVAIHAPIALLHAVGVPGDLDVDEPRTVVLQVDALRGGIGGEQNPHRRDLGAGLEGRLNPFALVRRHPAVEAQQALAAAQPGVGQHLEQPALRVAILGEDDHPLGRPLAVGGEELRLQPADEFMGLLVGAATRIFRPRSQRIEQRALLGRQGAEQAGRGVERVVERRVRRLVIAELLIGLIELGAQGGDGRAGRAAPVFAGGLQR